MLGPVGWVKMIPGAWDAIIRAPVSSDSKVVVGLIRFSAAHWVRVSSSAGPYREPSGAIT